MTSDASTSRPESDAPEPPPLPLLHEPRDGVPAVIDTPDDLAAAARALAAASGPVAVDAERASGFRYGQRAFLIQLRRAGAGTFLIDPEALHDLSSIDTALRGSEWILHAATQDLPCLADTGMTPDAVFDTELAARLLSWPKVGLAAVVERMIGVRLAKEHSAVDWSTRPLPEPWLRYAALDVEVLIELRGLLADELEQAGKAEWARQEFLHLLDFKPTVHAEPWRRVSGLHTIRAPRALAIVREMWQAREDYARQTDVAPGRVLPDAAIIAAAKAAPTSKRSLLSIPAFRGRAAKSQVGLWFTALQTAARLDDAELPQSGKKTATPPPPRMWPGKNPEAAERLTAAKAVMASLHEQYEVPAENLMTPSVWRAVCWEPPQPLSAQSVDEALSALGARPWQRTIVAGPLTQALAAADA
ncbi:HRDC domain-containing protein [Spelaeicoccus albus]|uniref:Ribonuclease D n=1 Tax=Spelaeicoccus albus TaxID=1280376 RepID=A0A7Z0D3F5_9MICO|nr:HRDC domain-containing protein [Spelaeicoccus albus]NYI68174.1 ribonuclease D [Spelaeicoccus albus]